MSLRITACALYNLYNDQLWLVWWDRLWLLVLVKMCHQKHCLCVTGNQIWGYFQTKHIIIDVALENIGEMSSKPQKSSWKPGSFELRFVITSSSALPVRLSFMIWKVQVNLSFFTSLKKEEDKWRPSVNIFLLVFLLVSKYDCPSLVLFFGSIQNNIEQYI